MHKHNINKKLINIFVINNKFNKINTNINKVNTNINKVNTNINKINNINKNYASKLYLDNLKQIENKENKKYTAIIVEPRKHKALEFVLNNFKENLNDDWIFVILCSNFNKDYVEQFSFWI
jgi:DNA repair ATPase RecN